MLLTHEDILFLFKRTGALLKGHFLLTSGKHSDHYFQCALVLQHPECARVLCGELAGKFLSLEIDLVIGPALGGIIVAHEVARALGKRGIFTERENGLMTLRRGFSISPGERALVVEDVATTGGSVMEVMDVVRRAGGVVAGVGVLVNRSGGELNMGVRAESLCTVTVQNFEPNDCPLCRNGMPIVKPGSRVF